MNIKNRGPVFVPSGYSSEIEKMSKAALMDLAWDFAQRCAGSDDSAQIMRELRAAREIVETHRMQEFSK